MKKWLLFIAMGCLSLGVFAQNEGDAKTIDGQKFTYKSGVWVHKALGDSYACNAQHSAVYQDSTWKDWQAYAAKAKDETLKQILALGNNVSFKYKGADGQWSTYCIFPSKDKMVAAVGSQGGRVSTAAWVAGGVATAVVIAVIVNNDDNSNGTRSIR